MCQLIVTSCICEPVIETNWPAQTSRKSRCRSAAKDDGRSVAGGRLVFSAGENLVALRTLALTLAELKMKRLRQDYQSRLSQNIPAEFNECLIRRDGVGCASQPATCEASNSSKFHEEIGNYEVDFDEQDQE
jgi:hypothetical protein